jgi:hypothetical protein
LGSSRIGHPRARDEEVWEMTSPGNADEDPDDRPLDTVPADQDSDDDREAADPRPDGSDDR